MLTILRAVQCGTAAITLTIALPTSSVAIDRLLTLGQIDLLPLGNRACLDAATSTDRERLEKHRTALRRKISEIDGRLAEARLSAQRAFEMRNAVDINFTQAVHVTMTVRAELKDAQGAENRKKLLDRLVISNTLMRSKAEDFVTAEDKLKATFEALVSVEAETSSRPHYMKGIDCVERRLAALRHTPPPVVSGIGAARGCKLDSILWGTGGQLVVKLTVSKGGTCEEKIVVPTNNNLVAQALTLFIPPKHGAAEVRALTTVAYKPKAGYAGDDVMGLFMQTNDGARTLRVDIKVQ